MYARISKLLLLSLLLALPVFSSAQSTLININTASSEELQTLDGIGPTYAQRIIDYRNANGSFQNIEEIKKVSGIGEATFAKIKDYITIGDVDPGDGIVPPNTDDEDSGSVSSSTHFSAVKTTYQKPSSELKIGAGRERIGSVGSPIEFKAEANFGYSRKNIFRWNFGDGTHDIGDVLTHIYDYPGEYIVVLRATTPEGEAVARTKVKIIEPEIAISYADKERIELLNSSAEEVNLFGRALFADGESFIFPVDTIIGPGQRISFGSKATNLFPESLYSVWLVPVGEDTRLVHVIAQAQEQRLKKIASISFELDMLQDKLASIEHSQQVALQTNNPEIPKDSGQATVIENADKQGGTSLEASAIQSIGEVEEGFFKSWFETLKRFFLRTQ